MIRLWVLFVVHHVLIVKLARFAELVQLLIVHVVDRAVWAYPRVRDWRQRGVLHPRGFDCFVVEFFPVHAASWWNSAVLGKQIEQTTPEPFLKKLAGPDRAWSLASADQLAYGD